MGSSIALALKRAFPGIRISGVDQPDILKKAHAVGSIDSTSPQSSELTILAAPVGEILRLLEELKGGSSLILDLGSTKVDICKKAELRRLPFAGGHPMTGSERSGPGAASADIFKNACFFLCPVSSTPAGAIEQLEDMTRSIGAIPQIINPEDHDKLVSQISHLPQVLSTLLAVHSDHAEFAGPGWRSLTRLAASPFHVWRDILLTSGSLPDELRSYIRQLQEVLDALDRKDSRSLEAIFERANRAVHSWPS